MKKVILTAAAALALFATSFAQNATAPATKANMTKAKSAATTPAAQGTPAPTAEAGKEHGKRQRHDKGQDHAKGGLKALGLSAEQETQFKALNQAHKSAVKAVQSDASLAADAKKAQVAALSTKYESDVQGMMNADQFAKWTAARNKPKQSGEHKKGDNHKMDAPADGAAAPTQGKKKKGKPNKTAHN
ncbi:MAG: hypothetical protein U5L45_17885 [Saprospiraceae bacterium]|nr:hypothetical protein [Saprospiraceae bacterium]